MGYYLIIYYVYKHLFFLARELNLDTTMSLGLALNSEEFYLWSMFVSDAGASLTHQASQCVEPKRQRDNASTKF